VRYLAMELVDGPDLAKELERLRAARGAADTARPSEYFRRAAEIVRQAADGLAHAHSKGIVHRDVKPSNLLVAPGPLVKVADFGLARDDELGTLTSLGDFLGTPHYTSPEQARTRRNTVDHRTDVYALGAVLYELLTLRRPFEGDTSETGASADEMLERVLAGDPPRIRAVRPDVPRELAAICARDMARAPDARYADAGELRDELARFLAGEPVLTKWRERRVPGSRLVRRCLTVLGLGADSPAS
jgi:serine/threonine protein kinase